MHKDNEKDADANDQRSSILVEMSLLITEIFGTDTGHGSHVERAGLDPPFFCSFGSTDCFASVKMERRSR
jgi:hypothetical protein